MKIKTVTTKEVVEEKEINIPSFWKYVSNSFDKYAAIYSEDKVVSIMGLTSTYSDVTMCRYAALYNPERIFTGVEISEQEFNEALAKSLFIISGVEVCTPAEQLY